MEEGWTKRGLLRDYSSLTPHPIENMEVVRIQRVENPVLYDAFGAMESKWRLLNANRPKAEQIDGDPSALMYHGTSRAAAESICRVGFSRAWTTRSQYGVGNYFTDHPQLAIRHHCTPDGATRERTLLVCRVLRGRQIQTKDSDIVAPKGYDTGGDYDGGRGWITVSFEDSNAIAAYVVTVRSS